MREVLIFKISEGSLKEIKQDKKEGNKNIWLKYNLRLQLSILIFFITISSYTFFVNYKTIKEKLYIKNISKNVLSFSGKLSIKRTRYSGIAINDHQIIVIGTKSKIAEIYDVNIGKSVKEIKLKNDYNDDFLFKISSDKILVIGHTIEIIDIKNENTEEILIPPNNYLFTKGFAFKLNDEEIYMLLGRCLGKSDTERTKSYVYNIKTKQIHETESLSGVESLFLDDVKNMFITIDGNTYTASCSYNIKEFKEDNSKIFNYIPKNCNIQKYNNSENKFEIVKILENRFPYYILKYGNDNFIIFYPDKILNYDVSYNKAEVIEFDNLKPFKFKFIADLGAGKILLTGNYKYGIDNRYPSYVIDINNKTVSEYNFIDFENAVYGLHFGNGNTVNINNKTYFLSLLGGRNVYYITEK